MEKRKKRRKNVHTYIGAQSATNNIAEEKKQAFNSFLKGTL